MRIIFSNPTSRTASARSPGGQLANPGPSIQTKTHTRYVFRYTPVLWGPDSYKGNSTTLVVPGRWGGRRDWIRTIDLYRVKVGRVFLPTLTYTYPSLPSRTWLSPSKLIKVEMVRYPLRFPLHLWARFTAGGYIGDRQLVILAMGKGVTVLPDDSSGVPA